MTEPRYPTGGDPSRRHRLYNLLVRNRRISYALDELVGADESDAACDEIGSTMEPISGDYWSDCDMNLGWLEREARGRDLAAAGYVP